MFELVSSSSVNREGLFNKLSFQRMVGLIVLYSVVLQLQSFILILSSLTQLASLC